MAQVTFQIPDAQLPRFVAALCAHGGFDVVTGANAKAALVMIVKSIAADYERRMAQQTALAAVVDPPSLDVV